MGACFSRCWLPEDLHQLHPLLRQEHWSDQDKEEILALYKRYGQAFHSYKISAIPLGMAYTPLEHAISRDNRDGVEFLLNECHAQIDSSFFRVRTV
jgi:hypothetical protein